MPYTSKGAYFPQRYYNQTPKPKYMRPDLISNYVDKDTADKMISLLINYSGDFPPLVNMQAALSKGLTESQWAVVLKAMKLKEAKDKKTIYNLNSTPINFIPALDAVLNKSVAYKHFRGKLKLSYAVYTVRIKEIVDATPSRGGNFWKLKMKVEPNVDGVVNVCRMCGKSLTDHTSIVTGVGPYCAKRLDPAVYQAYKKDTDKFMKLFKDEVSKIGVTEIECWHNALDDKTANYIKEHLDKSVSGATAEPSKPNAKVLINHIEYNPQLKTFHIRKNMCVNDDVNALYDQYEKSSGDMTVTIVNPKSGNHVTFKLQGLHSFECSLYVPISHSGGLSTTQVKDNDFKLLIDLK